MNPIQKTLQLKSTVKPQMILTPKVKSQLLFTPKQQPVGRMPSIRQRVKAA